MKIFYREFYSFHLRELPKRHQVEQISQCMYNQLNRILHLKLGTSPVSPLGIVSGAEEENTYKNSQKQNHHFINLNKIE